MKRAVSTAPEPDAMICCNGFIGNDVESFAISEEECKYKKKFLPFQSTNKTD
jgi:hypothetical protein